MNLQTTILKRYAEAYPNETIKKTASRTGIQVTRTFRLFNGSEMKVSEYQSFIDALNEQNKNAYLASQSDFVSTAKKCYENLTPARLEQVLTQMKHSLKLSSFINASTPINFTQSCMA